MKRIHIFEIHDQSWCPRAIRDAETDYLQFVTIATKPYAAIVPILVSALQRTGTRQVVDLCSGAGGPWRWLQPVLAQQGLNLSVCLTDKYPNLDALRQFNGPSGPALQYYPHPVDATRIPEPLTGFRTLFSSFHHFRPDEARALLSDAVRKRQGIAVFEGTQNRALALLVVLLVPLMVLVLTPFIRPVRCSRLLWTYLLPVLPLVALFDGAVSCLRTYGVDELRELTAQFQDNHYHWDIGTLKSTAGPIRVTYLIGVPARSADMPPPSRVTPRITGQEVDTGRVVP